MYAPDHFRISDPMVLRDAARRIGAGHLTTVGPEGPVSSFVPLLVSDDAHVVRGHLARANPQWRTSDPTMSALLTWVGPDAYVSPSWYPSKAEHGRVVPTWDYIAVQVRGPVTFHTDDSWTRALVAELTDTHEAGSDDPWSVDDAPDGYIDRTVRSVVGFDVRVTALEGSWKLSQNRSAQDVAGVVAGMRARSDAGRSAAVADAVEAVDGLGRRPDVGSD